MTKRSPEDAKAQREAFLAAKAAKTATPKPVEVTPAAKPVQVTPPRPAQTPEPTSAIPSQTVSRREFLNYAWLASITLFAVETLGSSFWFAFPNFKAGQFGGEFPLGDAASNLPQVNNPPKPYTDGKFWLSQMDTQTADGTPEKGIMAIYKVCTHLGCLYDWQTVTNRFECPCHGSKFTIAGDYISGPARRSLDRFVVKVVDGSGTVVAQTDEKGTPLDITGHENDQLVIDTGAKILGAPVLIPA
ncbi:MAG: ubiquinol-cytochrome c reductase iron-sulfur subunit [Anaerolineae bacterium]